MEFIKIILLFSILIACSLSQRPEETQAVAEPEIDLKINRPEKSKGNCNGRYCKRVMEEVISEQRCTCFPLNSDNTLVPQYITNDAEDQLTRTVIYIYTIRNKSAIYIPNIQKQSLYTDLTFDDGDVLRPISSHNVNLLTSQEYGPYSQFSKEKNEDHTKQAYALESENKNQPIITQNLKKLDVPSISEDINKEALKHILKDDLNVLVLNKLPNSQKDFGQNGPTNPQNIGKPQTDFVFHPDENKYAKQFDKPIPIIVSKPSDKDILVHDTFGSQKDFDIYPNQKKIHLHHIDREPTVFESDENGLNPNGNELHSQQVNKPKNVVVAVSGSNFGNIGLKPNEKEIDFPLKGFGLNRDDNQLYAKPQDAFELKPIVQDKQIDNIDRPIVIPDLNPNKNDLHLHHFDSPIKELESKPSEEDINLYDNNRRDLNFGPNYNKDYFPLHHNAEPQTILGSNSNENGILVDNIAKPQEIFRVSPNEYNLQPIVETQEGFGSLLNNIPKPLKDFGSTPNEKDFYLNNIAQPQRKVASEIDEDDLTSASLFKPKPNIRCSSGICKLYIYCSKNDCPKYLQSLAKLHTSIHKHPHLENTFIALNNARANANNTDSRLKPFLNFIGLEDTDEAAQNIRSIQLGDQNPSLNHYGHLLSQQVPLPSISDQGQTIQNLLPPSQIQERRVEYYPRKKQISTQYRNSPYYRNIYIPRPINDQYYRRTGALTPESKHNYLKDLLLLPSHIHHKGIKAINDLVSNLSLRKNNPSDEEGVSEGIEVPVEEDDIKIKIIGGQPAVSSGTPMQIKARLGDVV